MANLKTEIILSMNGKAAIQVLEALRDKAKAVREEIDNLDKGAPDFKEQKAGLEKVYDALQSAHENVIKDTERLDHALQNLTSTSLQNLRKALGDGRRQLQKLSEDELEQADELRKKMKQAGDEIRLLEGQYVKIADGLKNVSNQSDQWLDKAIKQQRNLVGSLEKSDAGYQKNLSILKQLEAEEDRRKGKMNVAEARQTVSDDNASVSDLRRAKATLTEARDKTAIGKTGEIDSYNRELQEIEKRLEAVSGKAQKVTMSWNEAKQVLAAPNKATGEDIKRTMEVIQQKIQQLPAGSKFVADLRRQYSMLEQTLKGTRMSQSALNDILARSKKGKASLDELRRAYKQLEEELNQINIKSKEFADKQKSMKELKKNIDEVTGAANKQGGAWQTAMKNLTAYVGLFAIFNHVKDLVAGAIKKNFEYSGSLTDIRKVSGLTMEQVKQLSTELAKIDTRTSVDGLAQLAYEASKLGVGKYGVEGMAQFVRAADKINVAIGEEMGEKALPSLLKMTEVMGLIPKMGLEKSIEAVGSSMFKLASTSTATSSDITEFAKRCTGVARTAGITTDQLLALGSAFSAQMASPEVAATAMSKFIVALQKNHNLIEKDLAIPAGTINSMYQAGNAMDAIVLILEKMKEKGNMNALGEIFKDVGGDGQRLISSMVTMAKNVDMLKDHLYESQEAFEEATAVGKEYSMQQQSAIGILERANNLWEKAFVNPDGVDAVKSLAEFWYEMSATMTNSPLLKGTLLIALQMVLAALKAVAFLMPVIIGYMASQGLYSGLRLLWQYVAALGMAGKAMFQYVRALFTANAAQSTLNKTMKLNPWIALASVIIGVAGAIYGYAQRAKEAAEAAKEAERQANAWRSTLGQAAVETANLNKKLANYKRMMSEANLSQKERQGLISRFNRDFRSYINKLGIEIKSVKDLRDHYSELAQEAQRATYYRMREQAKQQALPKLDSNRNAASNALMAHVEKLGLTKLGVTFQDIDRWVSAGMGGDALFMKLVKMAPKDNTGLVDGFNWKIGKQGYIYRDTYDKNRKAAPATDFKTQKDLVDFLSASRWYVNATRRRSNTLIQIDKSYKNWVPEGYTDYTEDDPGTLGKDAPDNDAIRQEAQDRRDQERAWREELKQKQDEANAIMDNVHNFYERQINAKMEQAISLGMDKSEQDLFVEPVKQRMNQALEQVRLAIAGQANTWEQFKLTMKDDLIEQTDETGVNLSEGLLKGITSNNIDALRKKLNELGNNLNRPLNSILAEVFAKATKNAQDNLKLATKQQEARRKTIQEHDYTGVVQQSSYDNFNILGYANPTEAEVKDKAAFDKRKANIIAMFEKARTNITKVFSYDMSKEEDRGLLLKLLFGDDSDGMGKRIAETLGSSTEEWQAFYQKLIQYNDEYESANKKGDDERKKLNDYGWSKDATQKQMQTTIDYQEKQNKETSRQYSFGAKGDTITPWGQTEATDPELALLKLKYDLAKEYYKYVENHKGSDEQKLDAAKKIAAAHDAIMDSVVAKAKATAEAQMKWYKPIEQYGSALGEALTDESKSVKDATKSMINSFIDLTGEYVQQKLTQWVMTKLYNSLMAESEQELVIAKQVAATENATTAVTEAGVEVAAGTAAGAAKTIGTLGWWGIPLIAVIGAVLGGLLSLAKGALSNAFGSNKNNNDIKRNFKVTSGMLTYDSGNVQDLRPFVDNNGSLYWATEDDKPHNGVSLLTHPTATTINGHPSLVAENGPELVIGRETTQAMMMNNPQLLKALVNFDRNYSGRRAYDTGNIAETSPTVAAGASVSDEMVSYQASTNVALLQAVNTLLQRLEQPIEAKIDMYGRGKLYDSMTKANQFMKNK
ncbi:phage tail tape measure protein [Prevotella sp.]|uniref:phage tail tape measure protein n=1 Tax=Prevotella sp. TaxID=59823 RepID=UPI004029DBB9